VCAWAKVDARFASLTLSCNRTVWLGLCGHPQQCGCLCLSPRATSPPRTRADPWNWNAYLFPAWCLGVVLRNCVLFPVRITLLLLANLLLLPVFFSLGLFMKRNSPKRQAYEQKIIMVRGCAALLLPLAIQPASPWPASQPLAIPPPHPVHWSCRSDARAARAFPGSLCAKPAVAPSVTLLHVCWDCLLLPLVPSQL